MVSSLCEKCFGTDRSEHRRQTTFSKLAQCEMTLEATLLLHYHSPNLCSNHEGCCVEENAGLSGAAPTVGRHECREWEIVQEGYEQGARQHGRLRDPGTL